MEEKGVNKTPFKAFIVQAMKKAIEMIKEETMIYLKPNKF